MHLFITQGDNGAGVGVKTQTAIIPFEMTILQQGPCYRFLASLKIKSVTLSIITIMNVITEYSDKLIPSDVFCELGETILNRREKIRLATVALRRQMHYDNQAQNLNLMSHNIS